MDGRLDPCTPNLPLKRQCNAARPLKSSESTRPLAPTLLSFKWPKYEPESSHSFITPPVPLLGAPLTYDSALGFYENVSLDRR